MQGPEESEVRKDGWLSRLPCDHCYHTLPLWAPLTLQGWGGGGAPTHCDACRSAAQQDPWAHRGGSPGMWGRGDGKAPWEAVATPSQRAFPIGHILRVGWLWHPCYSVPGWNVETGALGPLAG